MGLNAGADDGACPVALELGVMNVVLVVTLVRLGFSGTALKPPRIFMYLSLQQLSTMYLLF